jgi:hypothetical protein
MLCHFANPVKRGASILLFSFVHWLRFGEGNKELLQIREDAALREVVRYSLKGQVNALCFTYLRVGRACFNQKLLDSQGVLENPDGSRWSGNGCWATFNNLSRLLSKYHYNIPRWCWYNIFD